MTEDWSLLYDKYQVSTICNKTTLYQTLVIDNVTIKIDILDLDIILSNTGWYISANNLVMLDNVPLAYMIAVRINNENREAIIGVNTNDPYNYMRDNIYAISPQEYKCVVYSKNGWSVYVEVDDKYMYFGTYEKDIEALQVADAVTFYIYNDAVPQSYYNFPYRISINSTSFDYGWMFKLASARKLFNDRKFTRISKCGPKRWRVRMRYKGKNRSFGKYTKLIAAKVADAVKRELDNKVNARYNFRYPFSLKELPVEAKIINRVRQLNRP